MEVKPVMEKEAENEPRVVLGWQNEPSMFLAEPYRDPRVYFQEKYGIVTKGEKNSECA